MADMELPPTEVEVGDVVVLTKAGERSGLMPISACTVFGRYVRNGGVCVATIVIAPAITTIPHTPHVAAAGTSPPTSASA